MPRCRLTIVFALGLVAALVAPSSAQTDVDVALDNPGGSRTLYVENLLGSPLTTLDFGVSRLQPFRVRVVDSTMDRSGFTVSAEMTNLYLASGSSLAYGTTIPSSNVQVQHPLTAPLNVLNVSARIQPVFDLTADLGESLLCTAVTVAGGSCTVAINDVTGVIQTLPVTVNLADLDNLPLLPQGSDTGAFANPSYLGAGAGDPAAPTAGPATAKKMIGGLAVSTAEVLAPLQAALAGLGTSATGLIDAGTLASAVRDGIGGTVWDALSLSNRTALLAALVATAHNLVSAMVLGQTGTYLSFPVLTVNVPSSAAKGTYRGTLVVTGLQGG